jgi:hypothetical protein
MVEDGRRRCVHVAETFRQQPMPINRNTRNQECKDFDTVFDRFDQGPQTPLAIRNVTVSGM